MYVCTYVMYMYVCMYIHTYIHTYILFTTVESSGLMAGCSARLLCFSAAISCSCTVVSGQLHWIGGFRNYFLGLGLLFGCSAVRASYRVRVVCFPSLRHHCTDDWSAIRGATVQCRIKSTIGSMAFRDNDSKALGGGKYLGSLEGALMRRRAGRKARRRALFRRSEWHFRS